MCLCDSIAPDNTAHCRSSHNAVTHVRKKNSSNQGKSPLGAYSFFYEKLPYEKECNLRESLLVPVFSL